MKKLFITLAILLASLPLVAQHTGDEFPWDFYIPEHEGHLVILYDAYESYHWPNMYMWGDVNDLGPDGGNSAGWPGWSAFTAMTNYGGIYTHFYYYDVPETCSGLTENLIFNDWYNSGYQAEGVTLTIGGYGDITLCVLTSRVDVEEVTDLEAFFADYFYNPVNPRDPVAYDPANPADPTRPSDDPIIPTALDDATAGTAPHRVLVGSRVLIYRGDEAYDLFGNRVTK